MRSTASSLSPVLGAALARAGHLAEGWAAPLALGFALSVSQAPASTWAALFLALPLIAWLHGRALSSRAAARIGWLFGVGYFLPGLLWIGEAFLVEADRFAWMRPFAVTLLPMGLALFWAAAFWSAARVSQGLVARGLALALALSIAEIARSTVLTGLPWGLFAFSWIDTPVSQGAAWIGPYALNTMTIFAALSPYWLLLGVKARLGERPGAALPSLVPMAAGVAGLVFLIGFWSAGSARLDAARLEVTETTLRLVQPNTPQDEKWEPEFVERNLYTLINLSGGPVEGEGLDLVVWPESATPYSIETDEALRAAVMARLPKGARLAYGALREERPINGPRWVYNSLFVVGPGPEARIEGRYDKHHLVPFGEYVPFESWLEPLGVLAVAGGRGGFDAGPGPRALTTPELPPFQPLICYEAIFPHERLALEERPEWLLQVTNDAWFGETSGPWQHLVQARFRSIEQGLPLYRSANTGVSAGVDPYGRILAQLPVGRRGVLDLPLVKPIAPTLYLRWGEGPLLVMLGLLAAAVVAMRAQERFS